MAMIGLGNEASLVEFILFAFMAMNVLLSGSFLLHRGVRKLRLAR